MKNAKLLWRILGYVLIPALFFCLGNSLRAQDVVYTGDFSNCSGASNSYKEQTEIKVANQTWKSNSCYYANNEFRLGASGNPPTTELTSDNYKKFSSLVASSGSVVEMQWDVANVATFSITYGTKYGTVSNIYILVSTDGGNTYTEAKKESYSTTEQTITYTHTGSGNSRYAIAIDGAKSRLQLKGVEIKANASSTPFVNTEKTDVSYKIQPTANLNETLSFTAGNLTSGLTVSVTSATDGGTPVISVDKTTVEQSEESFDLTLTTSNLAEGTYSDKITIKMGEETMATVTVKLNVEMNYPYKKITTDAELKEGTYLIVCDTKNAAAGAMSGSFLSSVTVDITDNTINDRATAEEFLLEKNGTQWYIKNVESGQYLKTTDAKVAAYDGTAFPWTIGIAAGTATITSSGENHGNLCYNSNSPRFLNYTSAQTAIQLYKKQVPEAPTCEKVKVASDGAVDIGSTTATIHWDAPDKLPESGYKVTLTGPSYNEEREVGQTEETQVEFTGLTPEVVYNYTIVSVCGEDFESDPVEATFTTLAAASPKITITSPTNNTIFTGDVAIEFTTENFELDATHLVKAALKEFDATDQVNASVLQTLYTGASPLTISGLADGQYHVDLYMVEVATKAEGSDNDTNTVGFNGDNYVHRTFEVKHPAVYFTPQTLKLTTFLGAEATDTVKVTGWALPESSSVDFSSSNSNFTITPNTLTQAQVMTEGGAKIAVTYNGADAAATAEITATCNTNISATFTVNAIARDTLANLKGIYSKDKDDTVLVRGKMVVTHKDSKNSRIWVQDIDKENGASMLLYNAANGYADIQVGDVLENVAGAVDKYSGLYELKPFEKLVATENGHSVYVDTLSLEEVNTQGGGAEAQNALVCIKDVQFKDATGNFANGKNYTLQQGDKTLTFRSDLNDANYFNTAIPTSRLYITVLVGYFNAPQVAARNLADMVAAPCTVPENINADEVHANEATIIWEGWADNYSLRYAKTETDLESATVIPVAAQTYQLENLDASTTYYYQVKSVCGADNYESEWSAVESFTTLAANAPTISITAPTANSKFERDSVMFTCRVKNFVLGTGEEAEGSIKYTITGTSLTAPVTGTITDTFFYRRFERSGKDTVRVELVDKSGASLNPVKAQSRAFTIDLPDVAKPVFTPGTGRYKDSVEVTLNCDTEGASIFYAQGEGEWVAYAAGSKILLKESATLKAFACKARMDTSAVATETYTIYSMLTPEGDVILAENFDAFKGVFTNDYPAISNVEDFLSGWSAEKPKQGDGCIVLGTGKAAGSLSLPKLDLSYDNGKYYVVFTAQAWKNDKTQINLIAGGETVSVSDLDNSGVYDPEHRQEYVFVFNNGTEETQITFAAAEANNNRFFLDSIRIYQVLPNVPRLTATPAMFEMNTVQGTPASQKVTVKGNLLASDVTVSCLQMNDNFSVSAETLTKEAVMGENGAELTVTFNASVAEDSAKIELVSGDLRQTVMVRAFATSVVEVENIAALRAGEQNTLYKVKGEVVVTAVDGNSTWVQDATAAIQIYGATGATYAVGDGITGIVGTLSDYHSLIELVPSGAQPAATTHNNVVEPQIMTVEELKEKGAEYSSRLIRINGLALSEAEGVWSNNSNTTYTATDEAGEEIIIRTILTKGSYVGEALPTGKFDLIAIAGYRDGVVQVSPRVKEDIIAKGGDVDPCEAPTQLKAMVVDKDVTLTWNGVAEKYRVVVMLGEKEICNELVEAKSHELKNLEAGVYSWSVASVCEGGEQAANGENFEVKKEEPSANEDAEGLAFRIYPNPTTGAFYVEVAEGARMEIFNVGGVMIRNAELRAGKNEIRLDRSGIYFLRLTNAHGSAVNRVIVR